MTLHRKRRETVHNYFSLGIHLILILIQNLKTDTPVDDKVIYSMLFQFLYESPSFRCFRSAFAPTYK